MERIFDGLTVKCWYSENCSGIRLWRNIAYRNGKFILGKYSIKK